MPREYIKGLPVPPPINSVPEAGEYLKRLYASLSTWSFHVPTDVAAGTYEPVITAGTTAQYWRGDKSWQTLNQSAVAGLTSSDSPSFVKVTLTQTTGTAPLTITSTTMVTNLNADLWDGYQFADYLNQAVRTTDVPQFAGIILQGKMPGWSPPKMITLPLPSANLTDFTIFVPIIDDADIGAHCLSTGYDIRFTDASGNLLSYERESFSVTDGKATGIFWVKVPSILTTGTTIYCYYGNASATDGSTPADSWDANYKAVYHLNDYDTSHVHDSTVNANHGTKKGVNEPIEATGKIGKGQDFDGTDDYVNCGTGATLCVGSNDFTLDSWVYPRSYSSSWRGILGAEGTGASLGINTNNGYLRLTKVGVADAPSSNTVVPIDEWSHCVAVFDSTLTTNNLKYYLNGTLRATVTFNVDFGANVGTKYIGERTGGLGIFDGLLDEIRISSVARSAEWLAYEYANQNAVDGGLVWETPPADAIQMYSADYGAGDARAFIRGESGYPVVIGNQEVVGGDQASGNLTLRSTSNATKGIVYSDSYVRATTNRYIRATEIALGSANPGASGATWIDANANTTGGWRLSASSHVLRGGANIHADWDGASDPHLYIRFISNVDNTGGADTDTVDIRAVIWYKGKDDTTTRTQTVEVSTVVGKTPRYKGYEADFVINWDEPGNVLLVGDHISAYVNLETDTSEVDDVIIVSMVGYYPTSHVGVEDGDK